MSSPRAAPIPVASYRRRMQISAEKCRFLDARNIPCSDPKSGTHPLRGAIFGLAFVALRRSCLRARGWRVMWLVLVCLSIFGTFGPSPASLEGMIYTTLPLRLHLIGLPEVLLQSFLLAFIVFHWSTHPRRWIGWMMGSLFVVVMGIPVFGLMHGAA